MVFPWRRGRGTASNQLPCLKLRVGLLWAIPPTLSCASFASNVHYHHDVSGTTLPVPRGGAGWGQPDCLLSGQSYSGPKGWGCWGESLLDQLPLSTSPLPPARTKAGIEGQDWHFSQAPRQLRLSLALQGLSALTLLRGLHGLPCAIHKEELAG